MREKLRSAATEGKDETGKQNLQKSHFLKKICLSAPAKFKVSGVKLVMNINMNRK